MQGCIYYMKMFYKNQLGRLSASLPLLIILTVSTSPLQAQSSLQKFDDRILINLQTDRTPAQTGVFLFLSKTVNYGNIGIPAGLMIAGITSHDRQMRQNAVYIASSTASTFLVTALLKFIVKRPRPYIQNLNIVPVYKASYYSFPSGHTSTSFSTATAVSVAYPKWYVIAPAVLWASSVSYSRMYLGVHYPTDVAGGSFLGTGTALSLQFIRKN